MQVRILAQDPHFELAQVRSGIDTKRLIAAAPGLAHGGQVVPRFDVRGQTTPMPILTLTGVSKTFGVRERHRGQRGFNALEDVTIVVPRGQTRALVGESGCGKTTTLRIALGLEAPTSGSIRLDGTEISGLSWNKLRPLRRRAQLVHQDPFATLDPKFTIAQSVTEPLVAFKVGDRRSRRARAAPRCSPTRRTRTPGNSSTRSPVGGTAPTPAHTDDRPAPAEDPMTTLTSPQTATTESARPTTRLGFNTRVSFPTGAAARGLREGIELFQAAEGLGYQSGWAYQRHFDHYLSSPIPFFAAAGQHTARITLGSAVIPARYQEPILLAEAAGTADLLTNGRLQLAFSSGTDTWDAVFGGVDTDARTEGQRRLALFLAGVAGDTIHVVTEQRGIGGPPIGTAITVTPHSPGRRERIWYGSGSIAAAVTAAVQGLRLITGTILHDVPGGASFPDHQAALIGAYRAACGRPRTARRHRRLRSPRPSCRRPLRGCVRPTPPTAWNDECTGRPLPDRRGRSSPRCPPTCRKEP